MKASTCSKEKNADDNDYCYNIDVPQLRIQFANNYLLLSNNEQDLNPYNVSAVCAIACSTKQAGKHIGQKDLDFKSVFAVTNTSTIVSHKWNFYFQITGNDQLCYIRLYWLDFPLPNVQQTIELYPSQTHIYLPFDKSPTPSEKLLNEMIQNVRDPCVLLNMGKLKRVEIVDKICGKEWNIYKRIEKEKLIYLKKVEFKNVTFVNVTGSIVSIIDESIKELSCFRVYTCYINIPSNTN
ncbi:unnamed protein product [Didymodactylos carnosus]|uniref:Uncharacterized protein n=1 Tax=Didymodactylos carnosus TaxID=1234261 RepID=A0A814MUI0_9BILA|nr:unnamed protein product [Didymodactylos carnosus]CAF3849839.1 unnamed protein product [Didymodactylos carnosus]